MERYDTNSDPENVLELLEEYIQFRENRMFEKFYLPNIDLAIERAKGFASSDQLLEKIGSNLWELIEFLREK